MPPRWFPDPWATVDDVAQVVVAAIKPLRTELADFRRQLMAKLDDFQKALAAVDAETTRIGDYIQQLLAQLNRTDLTDAQEQSVLDGINAAAERLKGVGVTVEQPVPTEPLPPIPPV